MIRCDSFSELPGIHLGKLTVEDAMLKNSRQLTCRSWRVSDLCGNRGLSRRAPQHMLRNIGDGEEPDDVRAGIKWGQGGQRNAERDELAPIARNASPRINRWLCVSKVLCLMVVLVLGVLAVHAGGAQLPLVARMRTGSEQSERALTSAIAPAAVDALAADVRPLSTTVAPTLQELRERAVAAVNAVMAHPASVDGDFGRKKHLLDTRAGAGAMSDRAFVSMYFKEFRDVAPSNAVCLEWSTLYTNLYFSEKCREKWSLEYESNPSRRGIDWDARIIRSPVEDLPALLAKQDRVLQFDVILCTQVLEHIRVPRAAVHALRSVTAEGGLIYFSAPGGVSFFHGVPDNFFFFTTNGLKAVVEDAGLCSIAERSGGSYYTTVAYGLGVGLPDMKPEYMLEAYDKPWPSPRPWTMQMIVFLLARRSVSCERLDTVRRHRPDCREAFDNCSYLSEW